MKLCKFAFLPFCVGVKELSFVLMFLFQAKSTEAYRKYWWWFQRKRETRNRNKNIWSMPQNSWKYWLACDLGWDLHRGQLMVRIDQIICFISEDCCILAFLIYIVKPVTHTLYTTLFNPLSKRCHSNFYLCMHSRGTICEHDTLRFVPIKQRWAPCCYMYHCWPTV